MFAALFAMACRSVTDPDWGWHLRTGEYIARTHSIPHADIYSFTNPGRPWITHEWLSEVIMYSLLRAGGYGAVIAFFAGVIALSFWLVYLRSPGRPYIRGCLAIFAAASTITVWGSRPQMFSLLLASVFLFLLGRHVETHNARYLWPLPPLTLLWVNLHGGFIVGPVLIVVFAFIRFLDAAFGTTQDDPQQRRRDVRALATSLVLSLAVVVVNSNGWRMYAYPFETLRSSSIQGFITEWLSPDFHLVRFRFFLILIVLTALALGLRPRRPRAGELLLLCATLQASLTAARHIVLFAIVAVPIACAQFSAFDETNWPLETRPASRSRAKGLVYIAFAVLVLAAPALRIRQLVRQQPANEAAEWPAKAVAFIRNSRPPAPMYNGYDYGGYVIWKLYPEYRVFIDGRSDMYGDKFMADAVETYRGQTDWRAFLDQYGVRTVFVGAEAPLANILREQPDWQTLYEDDDAVVLSRGPVSAP